MFSRYDAEQILERLSPLEFYRRELHPLKLCEKAWCMVSHCPFHGGEEDCFYFNALTGEFHCPQCRVQGESIIVFTQKKHRLSFYEAVSKMIEEWNFYE